MPVEAPLYPVNLVLAGRRCLVVGGGRVARQKVMGLLEAEARVRVIAPDIGDDGAPQIDDDLALLINAWWEPLAFSANWDGANTLTVESDSFQPERRGREVTDGQVLVGPRSVVLLRKS